MMVFLKAREGEGKKDFVTKKGINSEIKKERVTMSG